MARRRFFWSPIVFPASSGTLSIFFSFNEHGTNEEIRNKDHKFQDPGVQIARQIDRLFTSSTFSWSRGSDRQPNMSRQCMPMSCVKSALSRESKQKVRAKRYEHSSSYARPCSRLCMESTTTLPSLQRASKQKQHQSVTDYFPLLKNMGYMCYISSNKGTFYETFPYAWLWLYFFHSISEESSTFWLKKETMLRAQQWKLLNTEDIEHAASYRLYRRIWYLRKKTGKEQL